jgi:hypothetical protein
MRKASRRLSQLHDNALEPCGLRSTQFAILAELNCCSLELTTPGQALLSAGPALAPVVYREIKENLKAAILRRRSDQNLAAAA